ncbi:MAG: proprotein convertase P-domain-containing protein [Sedimentisphaerales bacterium]|nr:proprotein convertase P-domain-containing protein [Sedimentisphaerales bacterium]
MVKIVGATVSVLLFCSVSSFAGPFIVGDDFFQPLPPEGASPDKSQMEPVHLWVDQHMTIADIDIYLDITHTQVSDLEISVLSPSGEEVFLKFSTIPWRESQPNMYGIIFDDEADMYFDYGALPDTVRFRPAINNYLSSFDSGDAYGNWTLNISDGALDADTGTLDRWELHIIHVPEPAGMIYFLMFLSFRRLRCKKIL